MPSSSKPAPEPVVKKTKPTQDPSGHISLSVAEAAFLRDVNHRFDKIEYMRMAGTLEHRPSRNPLRAEKTPRHKQLSCDDYAIPPLPDHLQPPQRWNYPDSDWGLMAKFRSQQGVYNKIFTMKQTYADTVAKFQADKAATAAAASAAAATVEKEKEKEKEKEGGASARVVGSATARGGGGANDGSSSSRLLNSARNVVGGEGGGGGVTGRLDSSRVSIANASTTSTLSSVSAGKGTGRDIFDADDLFYQKVSTMKSLEGVHPGTFIHTHHTHTSHTPIHTEILAKWRAKRASEFVVTQKHPLDPPTARDLTARPFKPGGGVYDPVTSKVCVLIICIYVHRHTCIYI